MGRRCRRRRIRRPRGGGGPARGPAVRGALRGAYHPGRSGDVLYSANWSGYAATGRTYQDVSASWTEPSGDCGPPDAYSSFWVGLDGYSNDTVEQTGSEVDCVGGQPDYYAWWEMYPGYAVDLPNRVRPGDSFTASGGILPLADFATVDFTSAEVDGGSIGSADPVAIDIGPSDHPTDQTSALSDGGTAFSVTYTGPTPPGAPTRPGRPRPPIGATPPPSPTSPPSPTPPPGNPAPHGHP